MSVMCDLPQPQNCLKKMTNTKTVPTAVCLHVVSCSSGTALSSSHTHTGFFLALPGLEAYCSDCFRTYTWFVLSQLLLNFLEESGVPMAIENQVSAQ